MSTNSQYIDCYVSVMSDNHDFIYMCVCVVVGEFGDTICVLSIKSCA